MITVMLDNDVVLLGSEDSTFLKRDRRSAQNVLGVGLVLDE
jgi:hypothetical protein